MMTEFPKDCTLIEWSEVQQTFFTNNVRNGKPDNRVNAHGVLIVYVCENYKIARKILDYMEKYIVNKSIKPLTTHQITMHIKALIKFTKTYCKQ